MFMANEIMEFLTCRSSKRLRVVFRVVFGYDGVLQRGAQNTTDREEGCLSAWAIKRTRRRHPDLFNISQ